MPTKTGSATNKETDYRKILENIAGRGRNITEVFADFACMSACALALETREEEYFEVIKKYENHDLNGFKEALHAMSNEMEDNHFTDILGPYYTQIGSKADQQSRGEFYTPQGLNRILARVVGDAEAVIAAGKPIDVCDPCVGSGGMVLALAEQFAAAGAVDLIRFRGKDIAKAGCDMAYINTVLWGIPAYIEWGDTLRVTKHKSWVNVHWGRVTAQDKEIAKTERMLKVMKAIMDGDLDSLREEEKPKPVEQPKPSEKDTEAGEHQPTIIIDGGQMNWDF